MVENTRKSAAGPIIILCAFFFIFGFVTWLNGVLIPYLKIACELSDFQSYLVAFAFYISYFVMAVPGSRILEKTGFKNGMTVGLFIMALGALVFVPAALTRTYALFLLGLFILGTGLTILQAAVNPYVTIIGPIESAAQRISIMGICNKFAGVLAPLALGAVVLADADKLVKDLATMDAAQKAMQLNQLAQRVILPYCGMAVVLAVLGFVVRFSALPEIEHENTRPDGSHDDKSSVFQFPNLVLGVLALFLYVGVEVMAVDTISNYGQSLGVPLSLARIYPSYTLFAMVLGYIIGIIAIPKFISQPFALAVSAITGTAFSIGAVTFGGSINLFSNSIPVSVLFLAALGLANAIMWPAIWPLAIHGLGKFTKTASAMLIMAIVGGALLPLLYGRLAAMPAIGHQTAYVLMVPCYLFILYYSVGGYKLIRWR